MEQIKTSTHYWKECTTVQPVWKSLAASYKVTHILIIWPSNFSIGYLSKENAKSPKKKKRLSYRNVYDNFNYNSQKQKQKNQQQPGNNANVHQQNEETNCGTLIQQNTTQQKKRGKASASHNRMNASQNITVSGRSQTEKYVIIHAILFHLCEILGKATLAWPKADQYLHGVGSGRQGIGCKEAWGNFWGWLECSVCWLWWSPSHSEICDRSKRSHIKQYEINSMYHSICSWKTKTRTTHKRIFIKI